MNYYLAEGTSQRGPFTEQELAGAGLKPESLVWREGMPQWLPAAQVAELLPLFTGQTMPQPQPAGATLPLGYGTPQNVPAYSTYPAGDIAGKKMAAGLCGILLGLFGLGGLGIHKFVLGLTSGAVTMLCISIGLFVMGFITCGVTFIAVPIFSLIGLVEGIIYLTKTDAEFYQIYMVQKRQWF